MSFLTTQLSQKSAKQSLHVQAADRAVWLLHVVTIVFLPRFLPTASRVPSAVRGGRRRREGVCWLLGILRATLWAFKTLRVFFRPPLLRIDVDLGQPALSGGQNEQRPASASLCRWGARLDYLPLASSILSFSAASRLSGSTPKPFPQLAQQK